MDGSNRLRGAASLFAGLAACLLGLALFGSCPASAQGFSFFGNLFGGGQPQTAPPPYPGSRGQSGSYATPRRRAHRHPVEQVQKDTPQDKAAPKVAATSFVYVFGDSLGQLLANGLDDALSDRPEVAVLHKARGSSGLAAADYYDWPKAIDALLAGRDKIDVAVMMIGSNDRQAIHEGGKTYEVGSDGWNAAYGRRVAVIDEAFRKKGIPLVWVGVPITKDNDVADDMAALNDIFRAAAAKSGATYVDTWEAFSDEDGDFAAFGPDVYGQTVRLRTSDGIYLTAAGARKLAHFVEPHVRRDLDGKTPIAAPPASAGVATIGPPTPALAKAKPEIGPVRDLTEAPVAAHGVLASVGIRAVQGDGASGRGGEPSARPASLDRMDEPERVPVEKSLAEGEVGPVPAGRADDLRWPETAGAPKP